MYDTLRMILNAKEDVMQPGPQYAMMRKVRAVFMPKSEMVCFREEIDEAACKHLLETSGIGRNLVTCFVNTAGSCDCA